MAVAFTRSQQPGTEEATLFYGNERDADTFSIIKEDGKPVEERTRGLFAWETRSVVRRRVLQVTIGTLGIALIIVIICAFTLNVKDRGYTYLGKARFKLEDKMIEFKNSAGKFVLSGEIGLQVGSTLTERHTKSSSSFKYTTADGISLVLTQESEFSLIVNWTSSLKKSVVFMDCFSMKNSHWYGGSELLAQKWPLEKVSVSMGPYVPREGNRMQNKSGVSFGSVLERYWLSSSGVAVLVDSAVPLHVSINATGNKKLCLKSDITSYLNPAVSRLTYRILSGENAKSLHSKVVHQYLGKPNEIPHAEIIKNPIWETSGNSGNISQDDVEKLCADIKRNMYPCGNIIIKGEYSQKYENYKFDPVKFPNPKKLINELKSVGCNISLNIHPHIKIGSREFYEASQQGYLLQDCGGKVPGLIKWNNHLGACIDITRETNKQWFRKKLETFQQEFGFDSIEFHSGDVTHLPYCYQFYNQRMDPGHFATEYAKFAADFGGMNIHVGYKTQDLPIFVKMTNKDSTWDGETGLKSLIPTLLTFGIMGYPFVLPSVVGGRHGNPDRELYIRWMQASVFLPGIQFSKVPWDYDQETVEHVQDLLKLRSSLNPVILEAFLNATKTGAPVIRPLWWIAPSDKEALEIDSQFMLGDQYMVAPILEQGERRKAVYLPVGQWQEQFKQKRTFSNKRVGIWKPYDVELKDLLYFKCLTLYT